MPEESDANVYGTDAQSMEYPQTSLSEDEEEEHEAELQPDDKATLLAQGGLAAVPGPQKKARHSS